MWSQAVAMLVGSLLWVSGRTRNVPALTEMVPRLRRDADLSHMRARAAEGLGVSEAFPTVDAWLLRGLLSCDRCERLMLPASDRHGTRLYSCGPRCPQEDLSAQRVEQDMRLGALVRGVTTLYPDTAHVKASTHVTPLGCGERPPIDVEDLRRWEQCDVTDQRAVIRAAYVMIRVTVQGSVRPVWQHDTVDLARRVVTAVGR